MFGETYFEEVMEMGPARNVNMWKSNKKSQIKNI